MLLAGVATAYGLVAQQASGVDRPDGLLRSLTCCGLQHVQHALLLVRAYRQARSVLRPARKKPAARRLHHDARCVLQVGEQRP